MTKVYEILFVSTKTISMFFFVGRELYFKTGYENLGSIVLTVFAYVCIINFKANDLVSIDRLFETFSQFPN